MLVRESWSSLLSAVGSFLLFKVANLPTQPIKLLENANTTELLKSFDVEVFDEFN